MQKGGCFSLTATDNEELEFNLEICTSYESKYIYNLYENSSIKDFALGHQCVNKKTMVILCNI